MYHGFGFLTNNDRFDFKMRLFLAPQVQPNKEYANPLRRLVSSSYLSPAALKRALNPEQDDIDVVQVPVSIDTNVFDNISTLID